MSQWWKPIRDRIQRAVFNQQANVLRVLAENGGWMTYIEISFNSKGRVSSDNALTVLYEMRDEVSFETRDGGSPRVDFTIRRTNGDTIEVGSFWRISDAGRRWLEDRR